MSGSGYFRHPTAVVDEGAVIGPGTKVWHFCHVSGGAVVGARCVLGQNVYVAPTAVIGARVRVQNNVSIYDGVVLDPFAPHELLQQLPSHAIGDLFFAPSRLGIKRLQGSYAWESFIKSGVVVPGGSDAPGYRSAGCVRDTWPRSIMRLRKWRGQAAHGWPSSVIRCTVL